MKKQIIIATGLAVLSTGAYASKARLEALGQDTTDGSLWIADTYNKFRNPAYVNKYKNYAITEWGTSDESSGEKLEGGFFREMGSFSYGVYFNRANETIDTAVNTATDLTDEAAIADIGLAGFQEASDGIDLFFGGDMGIQWGARLHYASTSDGVAKIDAFDNNAFEVEHSALGLGLGIMMGDLGAYANLDIKNEYTGADGGAGAEFDKDRKAEGDTGLNLGVDYKLGNLTVFANYKKQGFEVNQTTDTAFDAVPTWERTNITLGVGHTHEVSSTTRIFTSLSYASQTTTAETPEDDDFTNTTLKEEELKSTSLPVVIGFETDATSWLSVRGSIAQQLPFLNKTEFSNADVDDDDTTNVAYENNGGETTTMAAGATLNFGKLKMDGIISNTVGQDGDESSLTTDNLLTKVSVQYWF